MKKPGLPGRVPLRHFLHLPTFGFIIPWVVVLNTAAAVDRFDPQLIATWATIHLVTIVFAGLPLLGAKALLGARGHHTVTLWFIVGSGLIAGATKGTLTATLETVAGFTENLTDNLLVRVLGASFAAVWVFLLTAYARAGLEGLERSRAELVRQNVATRLTTESSPQRGQLAQPLKQLVRVRNQLTAERGGATASSILEVVDETIRPLSRALWAAEEKRYPDITLRGFFRLTIQSGKLPAGMIALVWAATSFTALAAPIGLTHSAVYNLATGLLALAVWRFAGVLMAGVISLAVATVLVVSFGIVFAGSFIASLLLPDFYQVVSWSILIFGSAWMVLVVTGASMVSGAANMSEVLRRDRASYDTQSLIAAQSDSTLAEHMSKQLAIELHGEIQSRLVGLAVAIDEGRLSQQSVLDELDTVIDRLARLKESSASARVDATPANRLPGLANSWAGLLTISIDSASEELLSSLLDRHPDLIELVREALTNAHRHGSANTVTLSVSQGEAGVTLTITDNGYGPRHGPPGVGSALIERASGGNWTLSAHPSGGATLSVELPPLVPPTR